MSEFVETNDGRLINVAHIVTAEWRHGEWRLRLSDGREAYYRGEAFRALNFNDALDKLTTSHRRTGNAVAVNVDRSDRDDPLPSQVSAVQQEIASVSD